MAEVTAVPHCPHSRRGRRDSLTEAQDGQLEVECPHLLLGDSVVCPAEPLAGTGRAGTACEPDHRAESPPRAVEARVPGETQCHSQCDIPV